MGQQKCLSTKWLLIINFFNQSKRILNLNTRSFSQELNVNFSYYMHEDNGFKTKGEVEQKPEER